MSVSGSDSESRTTAVGRKRKNHLVEAEHTDTFSTGHVSEDSDGRSDETLTKRRKAERAAGFNGRQSSIESGEISASSRRSKESGELSSESEDGPDAEEDHDHDDDSSDTGSESDADDSESDESESDASTAEMSISSGDEYEPPDIATDTLADSADSTTLRLQDVSPAEQYWQYRYFRLTRPEALIYCLCCGARGHLNDRCPERRCPHCQTLDKHSPHGCPLVRKCSRCRQPGHDTRACTNQSYRGLPTCDVCEEDGHVEEECSRLWCVGTKRNYTGVNQLEDGFMRKVCYRCGDCGPDAHWGDDCPMYHRQGYTSAELNLNTTWSAKHADRFVIGKGKKPLPLPAAEATKGEVAKEEEEQNTINW